MDSRVAGAAVASEACPAVGGLRRISPVGACSVVVLPLKRIVGDNPVGMPGRRDIFPAARAWTSLRVAAWLKPWLFPGRACRDETTTSCC